MSRYSRPPNTSLYIRNVPDGTRPEELRSLFGKYGPIKDVYVPLDYYTRRPRGFAYVQFDDIRDAEDALYGLDRTRFYGRELEVEFAQGDRKNPNQMRVKDPRRSPYRGRGSYDDRDRERDRDRDGRGRRYSRRSRSRSRSKSRGREHRERRRTRSKSRSGSRTHSKPRRSTTPQERSLSPSNVSPPVLDESRSPSPQ
ncbi:PREDICTED: serine/arginine-rich splicing factor 10-like [Priapulus caudatus]|uniref:Serine/arginine-rich splicing factor 10-like n=1 Tax=Priapulus caudatus TaxID=37621 RepID=A0ABM1E975_PRICU|nr:PREDICTED: serine/arginine-rich splicing factor 10-like [Priapulus caudatus]